MDAAAEVAAPAAVMGTVGRTEAAGEGAATVAEGATVTMAAASGVPECAAGVEEAPEAVARAAARAAATEAGPDMQCAGSERNRRNGSSNSCHQRCIPTPHVGRPGRSNAGHGSKARRGLRRPQQRSRPVDTPTAAVLALVELAAVVWAPVVPGAEMAVAVGPAANALGQLEASSAVVGRAVAMEKVGGAGGGRGVASVAVMAGGVVVGVSAVERAALAAEASVPVAKAVAAEAAAEATAALAEQAAVAVAAIA